MLTPLLLLHISAATVGLLSGYLSMGLRKGSGLHRASGSVFFVSMLIMSSTAAVIASVFKPIMLNVIVSLLTFYLVSTAWWASRRKEGGTNAFDLGALVFILAVGVSGIAFGFEAANSPTGRKDQMPAALYFFFGTVALLCAVTDVRMLVRKGLFGTQRIVRHLWRMSLALLIATLSFYPGQAKLFPKWLRETNLLMTPHVLLIGAMIFWMVRMSARKRAQRKQAMVNRLSLSVVPAPIAAD